MLVGLISLVITFIERGRKNVFNNNNNKETYMKLQENYKHA